MTLLAKFKDVLKSNNDCTHRVMITVLCLMILLLVMSLTSYFSLSHQLPRSRQVEDLTRIISTQTAYELSPALENKKDVDLGHVMAVLDNLIENRRILDVSVYLNDGSMLAYKGADVHVRQRIALNSDYKSNQFNRQYVTSIPGKDSPLGFLRFTIDTHLQGGEVLEYQRINQILRLTILTSLTLGIIFACALVMHRRTPSSASRAEDKAPKAAAMPAITTPSEIKEDNRVKIEAEKAERDAAEEVRKSRRPRATKAEMADRREKEAKAAARRKAAAEKRTREASTQDTENNA